MANRSPYPKRGAAALFIEQAACAATDDCILWPFTITTNGYGQIRIGGRTHQAHRLALELAGGPAPSATHHAAHAPGVCHNRLCVNPRHLRWATRAENMADTIIDGTKVRGARVGTSKLTAEQVRAIRADTRTQDLIAYDHGIAQGQVSMIKNRKSWAWLD